ncbi:MAG: amidohydrolase family protein [Ginsengibacter sp.]
MTEPHSPLTIHHSPQKIDAHQHFWIYDKVRDSWITNEMSVIRKDFFPEHLQPVLKENGFDGCVAVQADQSENETKFLLDFANKNNFIRGVVGWIDLQSQNIEERLEYYKPFKKLKGFRHILQGEKDRAYMLKPEFIKGINVLKQFNYTYDILIFPDQLRYTKKFVELFPEQKFVIDHLAKPHIKDKKIVGWKEDIQQLAQYKNVYCKISGMVTEASWQNWEQKDFIPYIDAVINAFGADRTMFGSDWPVCLVAAKYNEVLNIVKDYFSLFTQNEKDKFFGQNAIEFYNL